MERIHVGDLTTGDKLAAGVASLAAAVRTLPMMAARRVVVVLQAEALLVPKRESEAARRALDELEALLKTPEPQTTLVLVAGTVDRRSRMFKLLSRQATLVECGVIEDLADAERWVKGRVAAAGMDIAPAGARLLAERAAPMSSVCAMTSIDSFSTRLGRRRSRENDVRQIIGPAALQDDWAMTNAIEAGDGARHCASSR